MKIRLITAAAVLALAALPGIASAQDSGFSVRLGGTYIKTANQSDSFTALGINFASGAVHVSDKTIPELDLYYAFTPNLVAELVLTYPQTHNVTLQIPGGDATSLGTFKHLPPSLIAQWHFLPKQAFDPYVGAGINFTWITPVHINNNPILNSNGVNLDLAKSSVGAAAEVGLDYNVDKSWYVNANVKYIAPLEADLLANGTKISTVTVSPLLYSVGVGYHF